MGPVMSHLLRALRYFRPDAPRFAGVLALMVAAVGLNLLRPWPVALIFDCVLGTKPLPAWFASRAGGWDKAALLAGLALAALAMHATKGLLQAAYTYLSVNIGLRGLRRVRNDLFAWLQRLSLRFHQGARVGDLIHRVVWDTASFQTVYQQGLVTLAQSVLSLGFMVAAMGSINGTLTLVPLATIPLLALTIYLLGQRMSTQGSAAQQAESDITALVQQDMASLPLTLSDAREAHEQGRFNEQTARAQLERQAQHGWEVIYWLAVTLVFAVSTAGTAWVGGRQVLEGRLTVGELMLFLVWLAQIYEPLNQLVHVGSTVAAAGAGVRRVFEILDAPEEVKDAPNARPVRRAKARGRGQPLPGTLLVRGTVTFDHVAFGYDRDRPVLHDLSFEVPAGQSLAIIGPSGSGKTTLLHLVPRFFDPAAGAVRLDGVDLRELRSKELRSQVALLLQEPILLPTTVAENIAYGQPNAPRADLEAAARAAHAHAFIQKLPRKYETILGDGGARLSVGEKQRLSLARAFLKDAPILLLDEPTSALDAESESLVVESLANLMRGRTTLVVAHRLTTIHNVDSILVLDNGRVAESGTPAALLRQGGYYARLLANQAGTA
jgi:ATP-binding cassette, subfamily B, bacterial